jgi:hypothetical protein
MNRFVQGRITDSGVYRTAHSSRPNPNQAGSDGVPDLDIDPNEPTYCYCNQVSFGDMVACDSESVSRQWTRKRNEIPVI